MRWWIRGQLWPSRWYRPVVQVTQAFQISNWFPTVSNFRGGEGGRLNTNSVRLFALDSGSIWPRLRKTSWEHVWTFMAILAEFGYLADFGGLYTYLAEFVTFVLNMLETWFWCLYPGFWAWEIHWDHFQTPQISLSGQIVIYGRFWPPKISSSDAQKLLICSQKWKNRKLAT